MGQSGNEDGGEEGGRLGQKDAQSFMRMTVEGDQMTEGDEGRGYTLDVGQHKQH